MEEQPKNQLETAEQAGANGESAEAAAETASGGGKRRVLKTIVGLFLLLCVIVAGFFAGIYLRVLDVHEINEKLDLYALPFIGQYFVPPAEKTADNAAEKPTEAKPSVLDEYIFQPAKKLFDGSLPASDESSDDAGKADAAEQKRVVLTQEEIERQQKEAEAAERKRVSKLARVYNEMKPEAAADIMGGLEDEVAVAVLQKMDESQAAKVLAALDPTQSARLTRSIFTGKRSSMVSPGDQMQPIAAGEE